MPAQSSRSIGFASGASSSPLPRVEDDDVLSTHQMEVEVTQGLQPIEAGTLAGASCEADRHATVEHAGLALPDLTSQTAGRVTTHSDPGGASSSPPGENRSGSGASLPDGSIVSLILRSERSGSSQPPLLVHPYERG